MFIYLVENAFGVIGAVVLTVAAKINNVVQLKFDENIKHFKLISQLLDQSKKELDFRTMIYIIGEYKIYYL